MSRYAVIIEGEGDSYSAYVPERPGRIAAGKSVEEVERLIREAVQLHGESLRAHGESVPRPATAAVTVVEVR